MGDNAPPAKWGDNAPPAKWGVRCVGGTISSCHTLSASQSEILTSVTYLPS